MTESHSIQPQKQYRILLIGDYCTDEYRFGTVERISPEAPVPIFNEVRKTQSEGMVGNVCLNLKKLGCVVDLYKDGKTKKTRLIDEKTKQHILRIDSDDFVTSLKFEDILREDLFHADAVVISDYDKGFVSYKLVKQIRDEFEGPIFVDTKKTDLLRFQGCFVKINESEYELAQTICSDLIVTRGANSVIYKHKFFPVPEVDMFDVCGAGDTFLAALAYAYCDTKDIEKSIEFAIRASTITVQQFGVYAPSKEEIDAFNWNG